MGANNNKNNNNTMTNGSWYNYTEQQTGDVISLNDVLINEQSAADSSLWLSERVAHVLFFYYTPAIVLTGSVGNILSVLVFFKTKLRKLSSSYYLAALGISDTCFLLLSLVGWLSFIDINLTQDFTCCMLMTFLSGVCSFLSVWFVVAFTVERFIAVLYPLKRQTMCTVRRAKMVLCGLTVAGVIINTPLIYLADVVHNDNVNTTICDIRANYKVII